MIVMLESGTDGGSHALYDPAATAHLPSADDPKLLDHILGDAPDTGLILINNTAGDGGAFYHVYVDQDMPERLAMRASHVTKDLLLRVPSGRLLATGIEYLNDASMEAGPYEVGHPYMVSRADISPGNYLVDVYEIDWNWDTEIRSILKEKCGIWVTVDGPVMRFGCMGAVGALVLLAINTIWAIQGQSALLVWWTWALGAVLLLFPLIAFRAIPETYWKTKSRIAAQYPENVLHFRRVPEGDDLSQYRGGCFGIGSR